MIFAYFIVFMCFIIYTVGGEGVLVFGVGFILAHFCVVGSCILDWWWDVESNAALLSLSFTHVMFLLNG